MATSPQRRRSAPGTPARPAAPRAASLLAGLPVGVLHTTNEVFDFANAAALAILRVEGPQLLGRDLLAVIAPEDRERVNARYWARQDGEGLVPRTYEVSVLRGDGSRARVEIEPRAVGKRKLLLLLRDIEGTARDAAIVSVLSEVALSVQRARTEADVLHAAGAGIRRLGMQFGALRLRGEKVRVEHFDLSPATLEVFEKELGAPLRQFEVDLALLDLPTSVLGEGRSYFQDALPPAWIRLLKRIKPALDEKALGKRLAQSGFSKGVFCPLFVHGEAWGLLAVASDALSSGDAAAVGLFASQVSSALETAFSIADLQRRNRELAAVHQVASAGVEADLETLAARFVRVAADSTNSDAAAILMLDRARETYELIAQHGGRTGFSEKWSRIPASTRPTIASEAWVAAVAVPEPMRTDMLAEGYVVGATVPLLIEGRAAGSLELARRTDRPYTRDELASAEILGQQVAIQLERARLYAEAQRRVRVLSVLFELGRIATEALEVGPLVQRLLAQAQEAMGADGVAILALEGDRLRLLGEAGGTPEQEATLQGGLAVDGESLSGRAVLTRSTQVSSRAQWPQRSRPAAEAALVHHAAATPLRGQEKLLGALAVTRRTDRPFEEDDLRLLEACAAQIGVAIEHARLFEAERRRVEDLRLLLETGRAITGSLDLEKMLEVAASSIARMSDATQSTIFLLDPTRKVLEAAATSSAPQRTDMKKVRIPAGTPSVAWRAMRARAPVRLSDARAEVEVRHDLLERFGQKSILALPLLVRDQPIGAVIVSDDARTREWSDDQVERATIVARQIAVAVESARAREQQVQNERLAALGQLAAVMAHEVRNPLGVIFNSLRSLRKVLTVQGDAAMLLDIVEEEAEHLNRIVGDLLDFARPSQPTLQPEALASFLSDTLEAASPLAAAAGVKLELCAAPELPPVPIDARLLRQAVLNLLINAIQAMPKGGQARVELSLQTLGGRRVARIAVRDSGPGVAPDLVERIFDPFFTTKATGTGLGLPVVKRIVDAHEGAISVESSPQGGAVFVVTLPVER